MHCRGKPQDGFLHDSVKDIEPEVFNYLQQHLLTAQNRGIERDRIVCDPGFGFGKTPGENLSLLANMHKFSLLDRPILVGLSRKSFLDTACNENQISAATVAALMLATQRGASIWRVHDVAAAVVAANLIGGLAKL
jgi:dihydropteroate synthase